MKPPTAPNETMLEAVARAICSRQLSGFCQNVGGDLGCKCGRGEAPHWSKCVASPDQLMLSGNIDIARAALEAMMVPDPRMIAAMQQAVIDGGDIYTAAIQSALTR